MDVHYSPVCGVKTFDLNNAYMCVRYCDNGFLCRRTFNFLYCILWVSPFIFWVTLPFYYALSGGMCVGSESK